MYRLGNTQELKRNFHSVAVLGLTCVLINTWLYTLSGATTSLINGGRAGAIWTFVETWICQISIAASMAEMASMAPSAGGQYHWVSEFAPPSMQRVVSYVSGWLSALGWQAFVAGSAFGSSSIILLLANLGFPGYEPAKWHNSLLTVAVGFFAIFFNIFGAKRLPKLEGIFLFLYFLGFLVIIIPIWILAPKASVSDVFGSFENYAESPSIGIACIIGQAGAADAFIGVDSAAHMAEEVKDASKTVPRMMMSTIFINGFLGLIMAINYVFAIQDIETQIINSTAPLPYVAVIADAVGTRGTIAMIIPILLMLLSGCINSIMAASRQAWSFARDDGLPFPTWFNRTYTIDDTPMPVNAMVGSLAILIVMACLNLASDEVVTSLIGLGGGGVGMTYLISILCVLWRRVFGKPLPPAQFSLGRYGVAINTFACCYQAFSMVLSFFPLFPHPNVNNFNWAIVVFWGVAVVSLIHYLVSGHKKYRGPAARINEHLE